MKRFFALLLLLGVSLSLLAGCGGEQVPSGDGNGVTDGGSADDGTSGGGASDGGADTEHKPPEPPKEAELFYELTADGTGYVLVHNGTPDAVRATVPATHLGKPVVAIGESVFANCTTLMEVSLPDGITRIGDGAFLGCTSLISFTLPASVTEIGTWAFYDCYNLSRFAVPTRITSIGAQAFDGTAYYNDANNWEDGGLYLGNYLLHVKPYHTGSFTVKEGTTVIVGSALRGCTGLTALLLPADTTRIGVGALYGCTALTEIRYAGTRSDWSAVVKEMYFDMDAGDYTVICSDGELPNE